LVRYVTPSAFLDLLRVFQELLSSLTATIDTNVRRYSIGLTKLRACNDNVEVMKEELNDLQPLLKQKTREVQGLLVTLEKDQKGASMSQFISILHACSTTFADANAMRVICARDTDAAAVKQRACQELKATCKADLDTALPALNSAVEALKSLSKV
jgi:dynein heavy chain